MQQFKESILSPQGLPLVGATVTVTKAAGGAATLYSGDGTGALGSNVITTGSDGAAAFYAANGRYTLTIAASGYTTTTRDVLLRDPGDDGDVLFMYGPAIDGVTDATTAVTQAVADAYAGSYGLYWADGTYLTTASIPHLHEVRHRGPGVLKRGSDLFPVEPREGDANTLYVSPTGTVGADGLSASQPMASFQEAFDALANYGPMLDGDWTVSSAAGTYTGAAAIDQTHTVPSRNYVVIEGPAAGHPTVPTCILDGTGGGAYEHGLRISGVGVRAKVRDLKFVDYTTSNSRIGLVGENEADLYSINVHVDTADWTGIYAFGTLHARIAGGILEYCRSGFVANSANECTFGYGAASTADGPIVRNATQSAVYWSRGSQGHVDYCKIEDSPVGLDVDQAARCHAVGNDFKRNTIAARVQASAMFVDGANVFNRGTADANGTNIQRNAYALEFDEGRLAFSEMLVSTVRATTRHTGATGDTLVITFDDIAAYRLENISSRVRMKLYGRIVAGTAGTTFTPKFDGNGTALTVLGAPLTNASFELESVVREASGGTFRQFSRLEISGAGVRVSNAGITFDPAQAITPTLYINLTNAGDDIYVDRGEIYILG